MTEETPVPPVTITGLDHLVLTVADLDQTIAPYQRALGMRPVTSATHGRGIHRGPPRQV